MADIAEICACPSEWAAGERPFREAVLCLLCNLVGASQPQTDFEFQILCDPATGQRICVSKTDDGTGNITTTATIVGTTTPFAGDIQTLVNCDQDFEHKFICYQDQTDPSIRYQQCLTFVNGQIDPALTQWFDAQGNPIAAPANVTLCLDEDVEFILCQNEFCALVDGDGYSAGDRIVSYIVSDAVNPLQPPHIHSYVNLSDGSFPTAFYVEQNGNPVLGTEPDTADFGQCPVDKSEEVCCGEECYLDNGETRTAIRILTKDASGNFTGAIRFIDSVTGADVTAQMVEDCTTCCATLAPVPPGTINVGYNFPNGTFFTAAQLAAEVDTAFGVIGSIVTLDNGNDITITIPGVDLSNLSSITNTLLPTTFSVLGQTISINGPFLANDGTNLTINTAESLEFTFI